MKNLQQILLRRIWLAMAAAIALCLFLAPRAHAQSLNACETWVVDSYGTTQTNCITEWYSGSTPELDATVQVDSYDGNDVPAVDAYISLYDPSGNLGTWDYDQYSEPTGPNSEAIAGVEVTLVPNDVYEVSGGYGGCWDASGNGGYYQDEWECGQWISYGSNNEDLASNIFDPGFQVASLLYPPPGNESTSGFGNFTTNGTTSSVGNSLQHSAEIAFSGGTIFGGTTYSVKYSSTNSDTKAYQTTLTNASGMTERANTESAYNPQGLNMPDHRWDTFEILLDPRITTASDDASSVIGYAADLQTVSGQGWLQEPDNVQVVAEDMLNGTVGSNWLNQQPFPNEGNGSFYEPGLASICQSLIQSEYNAGTCTTADQCGCQLSDFSGILGQDALLRWNPNNLTASPLPGYESPLDVDTSGNQACQQPTPSLSCRYVPVPVSPTNPAPQVVTLDYTSAKSFAQTDSTTTSQTLGEEQSYSVGLSRQFKLSFGVFNAQLTAANTWTWTDSESTGTINGTGNSMNVTLETNSQGCEEQNFVYEDTRYHTFVVQPPQNVPNCQ